VLPALPDDQESLASAGLPPGGAVVGSAEETAHGLVEVAERLLLHRIGRGLPDRTPPGVLFDGEVPHIPGVGAVPEQGGFLLAGWLKTVP
jgi:hypothetical protein